MHPGYFFDFAREAFLVVSLLVDPRAVRSRRSRACWRAPRGAAVVRRRQSGISVPLFSLASSQQLGHRRVRRPADVRALAAGGRAVDRADPADQRDAADRDVAVFGDDGDGARSDLHHDGERRRLRRPRRRARARRRRAGRAQAAAPVAADRIRVDSPAEGEWLRRGFDRFLQLEVSRGSPRAARFDAFVAARSVVARRVRAVSIAARACTTSAPWTRLAGAAGARRGGRADDARAGRSSSRSPTARTCSGSPPSSGPRPSGCRGRCASSAICRS